MPRRPRGFSAEIRVDLRHLLNKHSRHSFAGTPGEVFPRQTGVREGDTGDKVLRGRSHSIHLPRPRAPRRLPSPLRLPGGIAPPLEGFPVRRTGDADRRPDCSAGGRGRQLARGEPRAGAVQPGGDSGGNGDEEIGGGDGERREAIGGGGGGGDEIEIEAEAGVAGA